MKKYVILLSMLLLALSAKAARLTVTVPANEQVLVEMSRDNGGHWKNSRVIVGPKVVKLFIQPSGRRIYRLIPSKVQ